MDIEKQTVKYEGNNPYKKCQSFIDDPESVYIISGRWKTKFSDAVRYMYESITKLENSEKLENFSYTLIEQCLNYLNSVTVEKKLYPNLKEFITTFIFLAHNLNENTDKHKAVRNKIQYLQRYCDNAMTFTEYVSLMRKINKRISARKDWTPPSFRLSGHYYQLLNED